MCRQRKKERKKKQRRKVSQLVWDGEYERLEQWVRRKASQIFWDRRFGGDFGRWVRILHSSGFQGVPITTTWCNARVRALNSLMVCFNVKTCDIW